MAARRERERRRPSERRYNFATTEPELVDAVGTDADAETETDVVTDSDAVDTQVDSDVAAGATAARAPSSSSASSSSSSTSTSTSGRATRAGAATAAASTARGSARNTSTYRPFSDYKEEYAYVYSDLKRVAVVVGGLVIALLVLYFALPLLGH